MVNTDLDGRCDQQLSESDNHQKFMTLNGELSLQRLRHQPFQKYGWCPPKFKWFTWPNHAPVKDGLPSLG